MGRQALVEATVVVVPNIIETGAYSYFDLGAPKPILSNRSLASIKYNDQEMKNISRYSSQNNW